MSPALARIFTALHSSQWKARYGREFEALLADMPPTFGVIVDILRSAFRTQRRLVAAISFAAIAIAAASFLTQPPNAHGSMVAYRAAIPQVSQRCAAYTSIPRKAHGRCALG